MKTALELKKDELELVRIGMLALQTFVPAHNAGERHGNKVEALLARLETVLGPTHTVSPELRTLGVDYGD